MELTLGIDNLTVRHQSVQGFFKLTRKPCSITSANWTVIRNNAVESNFSGHYTYSFMQRKNSARLFSGVALQNYDLSPVSFTFMLILYIDNTLKVIHLYLNQYSCLFIIIERETKKFCAIETH